MQNLKKKNELIYKRETDSQTRDLMVMGLVGKGWMGGRAVEFGD